MKRGGCGISSYGIYLRMGKTYSRSDISKRLKRKGFVGTDNDHEYLSFCLDGRKTHIRTKVSHGGGGRNISVDLLKKMAEQCALSIQDFRNLLECPLDEEEYGQRVRQKLKTQRLPWHRGIRLPPLRD